MNRSRNRGLVRHRARGIVLLAVLITIGLGAVATMAALETWSTARQRENEAELLFIGQQFQAAIKSYYYHSPTRVRTLPSTLAQLLEDDRYPMPVRHLRRIYRDPMTGNTEWGLVMENNRIRGVYSLSTQATLKKANFPPRLESLEDKQTYNQWQFVVDLPTSGQPPLPNKRGTGS